LRAAAKTAPKAKVALTWVPWTHSRLAAASGYGAGVTSPGWYHHLFTTPTDPIARWLTGVAAVLRGHDLPVSTAHVIEAVRLADALAGLRGRPMPGLGEVTEATWSVLCDGNPLTLDLVTREAVVGEELGAVPDAVPTVPLDADLRARARSLRLKPEATARAVALDLRKEHDLAKSRFLRQLAVLGIGWGEPDQLTSTGTFKEGWTLIWRPEFAVRIVDAARHGTTVATAATAVLVAETDTLPRVTAAIETALLAGLDDALPPLLDALDRRAAHEADVGALLRAVPPMARVRRYGDVRRTAAAAVERVGEGLLARACAGLPPAASGLAEEAARELRDAIDEVQAVVPLLGPESQRLWSETLRTAADRRDVPGLVAGRLVRLLLDAGQLDAGRRRGAAVPGPVAGRRPRPAGGLGRGLPRRQPAARAARRPAHRDPRRLAQRHRRRGLPGRAADPAADVRRLASAGPAPARDAHSGRSGGARPDRPGQAGRAVRTPWVTRSPRRTGPRRRRCWSWRDCSCTGRAARAVPGAGGAA
jgi:hypothetical protein